MMHAHTEHDGTQCRLCKMRTRLSKGPRDMNCPKARRTTADPAWSLHCLPADSRAGQARHATAEQGKRLA